MHAPLGNHLAVEVCQLLQQPDVLQQRRPTAAGSLIFRLSATGAPVAWVMCFSLIRVCSRVKAGGGIFFQHDEMGRAVVIEVPCYLQRSVAAQSHGAAAQVRAQSKGARIGERKERPTGRDATQSWLGSRQPSAIRRHTLPATRFQLNTDAAGMTDDKL